MREMSPNGTRASEAGIGAVLAAVCSLAAAPPAAAQHLPAPDTVRYELEEIVVTAHRMPVARDRTSARVTVLTAEELEARGIRRVSEALRTVPGATVMQSGSFGSTTSLFLRGGESDYTQVLVDGVPVNQPGGLYDFAHLTTENVERVEVVRGPASVLYGSDAMTGTVQIFTRTGEGPSRASAGVRGGTYGSLQWDAAISGGGEAAAYSFSMARHATDGLFDLNNQYRNTAATGRVELAAGERTDAALSLRHADNAYHFPTNSAGEPVDENAVQLRESTALGLDVGYRLSPEVEAHVKLASHALNSGFDDRPDGPGDTLGFFAFRSQQDVDRWSADARLDWRPAPGTVLTVGGVFEDESERSSNRSQSSFGTSTGTLDVSRENRAVYAQALADLGRRVSVNAGVRVDDNEQFGTFGTYRTGAVFRVPEAATRLRASYGTGFKEPTFLENFAEGFFRGNPALEPERSRSWEAGVEQPLLGERISVVVTWFDQEFEDLIQFTAQPPEPGGPNFFNVAAAESKGLEVEASVRATAALRIEGGYTYLDTEVTDSGFEEGPDASFVEGDRLLRRPTHGVSLRAYYRVEERGTFGLDVTHVGGRDDRDFSGFPAERVEMSPYTTVGIAAEWEAVGGDGRPSLAPVLRVDNLFDEEYQEIRNFPAPGRTVFVGLRAGVGLEGR